MLNYYLFAILLLYVFNNIVNKIIYSKGLEEEILCYKSRNTET